MQRALLRFSIAPLMIGLVFSGYYFFSQPQKADAAFSACVAAGLAAVGAQTAAQNLVAAPVVDGVQTQVVASQAAKECLLDGIAVQLRETLIRKVTDSIVTWINSGFEGSPAFVQNIDQFLVDTADETFGEFIYDDENFAFLCSPFQFNIRFALALSYAAQTSRPSCTLSDVADNVENAIDDLSDQWSWDTFNVITTAQDGNYFSSYITATNDLDRLIQKTTGAKLDDLNRGGGFLSYESCVGKVDRSVYPDAVPYGTEQDIVGGADDRAYEKEGDICTIVTPGSVINQQLNSVLGSDIRRLELADELDEIFSALMGQLTQQIFSGGGISGLSQSNAGSQSFIDQYRDDTGINGQQNNDDIRSLVSNFRTNAESSLVAERLRVELLLDAQIQISNAYSCYLGKYNTDNEGNPISTDQDFSGTRATFVKSLLGGSNQLGFEFLTPAESLEKSNNLSLLLGQIDSDLQDASDVIEATQAAIENIIQYELALADATDPFEIQSIYQQFSNAVAGSGISTSVAVADPIEIVEAEIEQILRGNITGYNSETGNAVRSGGVLDDLLTCNSFVRIADN